MSSGSTLGRLNSSRLQAPALSAYNPGQLTGRLENLEPQEPLSSYRLAAAPTACLELKPVLHLSLVSSALVTGTKRPFRRGFIET